MTAAITTETVEQIAAHSNIHWTINEDGYAWTLVSDDQEWAISIRKHQLIVIAYRPDNSKMTGVGTDDDRKTLVGLITIATQDPQVFVEFAESCGDADIQHVIDGLDDDR